LFIGVEHVLYQYKSYDILLQKKMFDVVISHNML